MMPDDVTACDKIFQAFSFHICTGSDQLQEAVKTLEQDLCGFFSAKFVTMMSLPQMHKKTVIDSCNYSFLLEAISKLSIPYLLSHDVPNISNS